MTIVVLGATGGQGGAVLTALRQAGRPVRAVVRDPHGGRARSLAESGVELVRGDLGDPDSLADAFSGADAAFAVTTPFGPGLEAERQQGAAIVEAAERTALPHLVMASVASADRHTGVPHFETKAHTEQLLAASGVPFTVIAPTYFFENALGSREEIAAGAMSIALPPDTRLQQVSLRNLGQVVAAVLNAPEGWRGARIEVAGDDPTPAEMARTIGRRTGSEVILRQVPLEEVRRANADMGAMFTFLTDVGYSVDIPGLHDAFPGVPWESFADWAAEREWR